MSTYFEIKDAINERLKRAGLSVDVCPVVPGPIQNEGYYYEIHGTSYVYAYTERNEHIILCRTRDINEFYYAILRHVVRDKAIRYAAENRIPGRDTRRIWMKKAEEWMGKIDPTFGEKLKKEHAEILVRSPLEDKAVTEEQLYWEAKRLWATLTDEKWRFDLYIEKPIKGLGHKGGGEYYLYKKEVFDSACEYVLSYSERGEEHILVSSQNFQDIQVELACCMSSKILSVFIKKHPLKFKNGVDGKARRDMQLEIVSKCGPVLYEKIKRRLESSH